MKPEIIGNYNHLTLKVKDIGGKAEGRVRMSQRFLVWATQRIKLLFIKIENTGREAGLGGR